MNDVFNIYAHLSHLINLGSWWAWTWIFKSYASLEQSNWSSHNSMWIYVKILMLLVFYQVYTNKCINICIKCVKNFMLLTLLCFQQISYRISSIKHLIFCQFSYLWQDEGIFGLLHRHLCVMSVRHCRFMMLGCTGAQCWGVTSYSY